MHAWHAALGLPGVALAAPAQRQHARVLHCLLPCWVQVKGENKERRKAKMPKHLKKRATKGTKKR